MSTPIPPSAAAFDLAEVLTATGGELATLGAWTRFSGVTTDTRALRAGDVEQFGQFLFQSHASAREFFGNSSPELDLLVEQARAHPACVGARLSGAGFGGHTVNLVLWSEVPEFCDRLEAGFLKATGRKLKTLRCRLVAGAGAVRR